MLRNLHYFMKKLLNKVIGNRLSEVLYTKTSFGLFDQVLDHIERNFLGCSGPTKGKDPMADTFITLKFWHRGYFEGDSSIYVNGMLYEEKCDIDKLSWPEITGILKEVGYVDENSYKCYYKNARGELIQITRDAMVQDMLSQMGNDLKVTMYIKHVDARQNVGVGHGEDMNVGQNVAANDDMSTSFDADYVDYRGFIQNIVDDVSISCGGMESEYHGGREYSVFVDLLVNEEVVDQPAMMDMDITEVRKGKHPLQHMGSPSSRTRSKTNLSQTTMTDLLEGRNIHLREKRANAEEALLVEERPAMKSPMTRLKSRQLGIEARPVIPIEYQQWSKPLPQEVSTVENNDGNSEIKRKRVRRKLKVVDTTHSEEVANKEKEGEGGDGPYVSEESDIEDDEDYRPMVHEDDFNQFVVPPQHLAESSKQRGNRKNPRDNPPLIHVADRFTDCRAFREALKHDAVLRAYQFKYKKNDSDRITVVCKGKDTFPFKCCARLTSDKSCFQIKTLIPEHTCDCVSKNPHANCTFLARELFVEVMDDPDIKVDTLKKKAMRKLGCDPSDYQIYIAKRKCVRVIDGD